MKSKSKSRQILLVSLATFGLWAVSALALVTVLHRLPPELPKLPQPEIPPAKAEPWFMIPDRLGRGDTLAAVLHRNGFSARQIHEVAEALGSQLNVRHLRPGDELEIHFAPDVGVESIRIHRGLLETHEARREDGRWVGERVAVQIDRRETVLHGMVKGSLFASMESMGETAMLVVNFAEVFQWDFDFYTQTRAGDRFSVVVEKLYRDTKFVGYGDLKAARYTSGDTDLAAFLYEDPKDKKDYYDRNGKSMRKAFLRAPLKFRRISSGFSYSRLHPIHRRRMPHLGVDYAAPTGTPVHSVAAGVVAGISRKGGGGNQITLRHAMGYRSKYLHLSRFARGLRVGKRVQQKEVIGYVGMTGGATGPHLDFRLYRRGKPVNPVKQIYPPGPPVPKEYLDDFKVRMNVLARKLYTPTRAKVFVAE